MNDTTSFAFDIAFSLPTLIYYGLLVAGAVTVGAIVFHLVLKRLKPARGGFANLRSSLGLPRLHNVPFIIASILWLGIAGVLGLGLFGLIFDVLGNSAPDRNAPEDVWEFRFRLVQLTALTTVMAAVIALPITVIRLRLQSDALFNDKINEASKGLYARRQVTQWKRKDGYEHIWQDDIVQRNAAIDRLEGLAKENTDEVPRIARLLSVYVRELSDEVPAKKPPSDVPPNEMREWGNTLPKLRSDMEKAAQTLGRLNKLEGTRLENGEIDLRGANLQNVDLTRLDFQNALLSKTRLQGANLGWAHLQGANLFEAQLQGANLGTAQLKGAFLRWAQLQGADLGRAQLQEAYLGEAQLQGADLGRAQLQGAYLGEAQLQGANLGWAQLQGADLGRAQLQGANLGWAQLQGAKLGEAQLQGANLGWAQLQGANLGEAQLQGADLGGARLQGADLGRAQFDSSTSLTGAILRGARVKEVDFTSVTDIMEFLDDTFGDASVTLPTGIDQDHKDWPAHWPKEKLDSEDFETAWRAWQATLPEGWDKDIPKDES